MSKTLRIRSRVAREAWEQTGSGTHGGARRARRRRDRQGAKRELRSYRDGDRA